MWLLYQALYGAALLAAGPVLLVRRGRHYLPTLAARLGRGLPAAPPGALWLHAVSVGEAGVAATLARHLPPALPLLVTTVTPTGQERARAAFRDRGAVAYLPFDLGLPVSRFYDRFAPRALVLVEGDYWPLVLRAARRRRLPVVVVNGRVSDRTFPRLRRLRPLLGPLFGAVDRFGMQTAADRDRLLALGVPAERITVTGNLKFETPPPAVHPELEARLRALAGGRAVLLAGSTMAGEEEAVLDAHAAIGAGRALLLLAPRHPERWDPVAALVAARAPGAVRRSALPEAGQPPAVLLDSLGELAGLYRLADAAFVGGTLVPTGGHNPLEPARFGVPTAVGPSMENFREIAAAFDGADAWARVADAAGLAAAWRGWLDDPEAAAAVGARARALIATHRGAVARTLELLAEATGLFPPPVAEAPE